MSKRTRWIAATLAIVALVTAYAAWPRYERPTYSPHTTGLTAVAGTIVDEACRPLAGIAISWFSLLGFGPPQVLATATMGTEGLELPVGTTR